MGVVLGFQKNIENFSFGFNHSQEDTSEWMNRSVQTLRSLGSSEAGSVAALVATTGAIFYSLKVLLNRFGYSSGPFLGERGSFKPIILDLAILGGSVFLSDKLLSQATGNAPTSLSLLLTLTVVCSIANTLFQVRDEQNNRKLEQENLISDEIKKNPSSDKLAAGKSNSLKEGEDNDQFNPSTIGTKVSDGEEDEFAGRMISCLPTIQGTPSIGPEEEGNDSFKSVSSLTSDSEIEEEEEKDVALPNSLDDSSISRESVKNLQMILYTPPKNFFGKEVASSSTPFSSIRNRRTPLSLGSKQVQSDSSLFLRFPLSPVKRMENL